MPLNNKKVDSKIMDGIASIKSYVDRLVFGDGKCRGGMMKVLLLDVSTTQIVSCAVSQTEILAREVYLVSRIDKPGDNPNLRTGVVGGGGGGGVPPPPSSSSIINGTSSSSGGGGGDVGQQQQGGGGGVAMIGNTSHLKAVCFLRPTEGNTDLIIRELSNPRFSEYHLFFTGVLPTGLLRRIAENDEHELIRQVQEFYGDFLSVNEDLITLNCRDSIPMCVTAGTAWARDHAPLYQRTRDGLSSVLLALKRKPSAIRYQQSSPLAMQLAKDVHELILSDQIFHFRGNGPLLLVLDRMDDPVTPLLSQWTYQAMVHELLGLNNNRVMLRGAPGVKKDLEEVVLNPIQDDFFRSNRYSNFGELGESIKQLLDEFQKQTKQNDITNLNSIEDMQSFMEKFPQIKSQSYNVSKHVAIMGELARLVDVCSLMDVSQFEQELACADDHSSHIRELLEKLSSPNVQTPDKLRLGLLYALRYEQSGNVNLIKQKMASGGVPNETVKLVDVMLRYAGSKIRGPGLYGETKDIMAKMTKNFITSVSGVSNVYAQHVPVLLDTIQSIVRGKLRESSHPYVDRSAGGVGIKPMEIIVFMVGGVTYEEGTKVAEFNSNNTHGVKVILAGSTIHNSTSFLEELKKL